MGGHSLYFAVNICLGVFCGALLLVGSGALIFVLKAGVNVEMFKAYSNQPDLISGLASILDIFYVDAFPLFHTFLRRHFHTAARTTWSTPARMRWSTPGPADSRSPWAAPPSAGCRKAGPGPRSLRPRTEACRGEDWGRSGSQRRTAPGGRFVLTLRSTD